jgi:DNA-directed RNA polymerase specialized sigma24 family protein
MTHSIRLHLSSHLASHARTLHRLACGFGRQRDADDVLQTLYTRWWRRMCDEPEWLPPETHVELFVCVRRVVLDVVAMERRQQRLLERAEAPSRWTESPEESLHAFDRLQWILTQLPPPFAEALMASLSAGRNSDATVALELGVSTSTYTSRLFKARRAAEELATFFDHLPLSQAELMAELRFGVKPRSQVARERGLSLDELGVQWRSALDVLEDRRRSGAPRCRQVAS